MIIRRNFYVVLALLAGSVLAASIWGKDVYYRLIYLWGFLIASSWIWTRISLRGIRLRRFARTTRQQVGQIFEERFEINNESRFPHLWIAIQDQSNLPGSGSSRVLSWIGGLQQRSYISYSWLTRRGLFQLGPTQISSGDLFGLFGVERFLQGNTSLLVTPFLVELQSFPSPMGVLPGGPALRQKTLEVTPYAAGIREYLPGDSLNRIHWASTARHDRMMVKEFEQDPQSDVWIFVDAQEFVHAELPEARPILKPDPMQLWRHRPEEVRLPPATIEYAVSSAASIARYYLNKGHAVGLASSGKTSSILPAERGERQLGKIMENLAFLEADGDLSLPGMVSTQASYMPRGCTVVLITPSTLQEVALVVDDLQRRSLHPVAVLINAATFGGGLGTVSLETLIRARNIPVMQVSNQVDLRESLEANAPGFAQFSPWAQEAD